MLFLEVVVLAAVLPSGGAAALDRAVAASEARLEAGETDAAIRQYREALFEGWRLLGTLDRIEGRDADAQAAFAEAAPLAAGDVVALYALAGTYMETGDSGAAIALLAPLAAADEKDVETRHQLIKAYGSAGRSDEAIRAMDEAAEVARYDAELLFRLATDALWIRRADAAERVFARVQTLRPGPQTQVRIGRAYRDTGERDRARQVLRAALASDPRVRGAHYYLGTLALADPTVGGDRLDTAITEFRAELILDPQEPATLDQLGLALLESGRAEEALPVLEAAVRADAQALFLFHLARTLLTLDRPGDAAARARESLEKADAQGLSEPEREKIHYQLGLALRRLGREEEAAAELAEARRISVRWLKPKPGRPQPSSEEAPASSGPGPVPAEPSPLAALTPAERSALAQHAREALTRSYLNLGVLHAQGERFADAAALLDKADALDPRSADVQYALGVTRFNAGDLARAVGPLARAMAQRPNDMSLKRMLALACLDAEAYERAAELLRDDPARRTTASLQIAYGVALAHSGQTADAEALLTSLRDRYGESADLAVALGRTLTEMGDLAAAAATLERALEQAPDVAEGRGALGVVYQRQGRLAEAEESLRAALKLRAGDVKAQQHLAEVLEARRRPQEAIPLLRQVLEARPESPAAHARLGSLLLAAGDAPGALPHLESSARLWPDDSETHAQLARAYQKVGRKEDARREENAARQLKSAGR